MLSEQHTEHIPECKSPTLDGSEENMKQKTQVYRITFIALLGALSAVLMLINVSLPFAPSFLKFDIAELPALFAGFFMGPVAGALVIIVKILLKLVMQGTETAFVGEFSNVLGSMCFVMPAAIIYRKMHTKKGAALGLVISTILVSVVFIFVNAYIMFPLYSNLYGMPMEAIVGMGTAVNPAIHDTVTLMLYSVFPFNIIKHGVTAGVTWLVYKRCGNALRSLMEPAAAPAVK